MASTEYSLTTNELITSFAEWAGDSARVSVAQAPGRVNLIGEHTDYNDGFVLPMTISRTVQVAARLNESRVHRIRSLNYGEEVSFATGAMPRTGTSNWATYVGGMLLELRKLQEQDAAFEMLIVGNVPVGAGLSSSAALEMAVAVAVEDLAQIDAPPEEFARIGQKVEHDCIGVHCGIMDQIVSCIGRRGQALFLDCRTLKYRHVTLPLDRLRVVIIDSGVRRSLADSRYNERRQECELALGELRRHRGRIAALRDVGLREFEHHANCLSPGPRRRAQHVIEENARVQETVRRIEDNDMVGFGQCMTRSHASLRDLFEVSCSEIDFLVDEAITTPGVLGARITGGGFGGCTVNLVEAPYVRHFCDRLTKRYAHAFGKKLQALVVRDNLEAGIIARVT